MGDLAMKKGEIPRGIRLFCGVGEVWSS